MNITNKHGLPRALVNAVVNDPYVGGGDISVTRLIQPPQIAYLARSIEITEDVSDRIWALLGQCVHTILERAYEDKPTAIVEKRLYAPCAGWNVSGQLDVLEDGLISDWKLTSVYAREAKPVWVAQLNLLAHLCRVNNFPVHRAQIVAIYRDWRPKEALKDDYPSSQVAVIPVPLWQPEIAFEYLEERVRLHQQAVPPPCTDEERWLSPRKWALMQKGRKRAIKLFDVKPDFKLMDGQYWEFRPGIYRRCEDYCPVSHVCGQWKSDEAAARRNEEQASERQAAPDAA